MLGRQPAGCGLLEIEEIRASIVCFDREGQMIHLVLARRMDLNLKKIELNSLAALKEGKGRCWQCPKTSVSVAAWAEGEHAFLLLGEMKEALRSLL